MNINTMIALIEVHLKAKVIQTKTIINRHQKIKIKAYKENNAFFQNVLQKMIRIIWVKLSNRQNFIKEICLSEMYGQLEIRNYLSNIIFNTFCAVLEKMIMKSMKVELVIF